MGYLVSKFKAVGTLGTIISLLTTVDRYLAKFEEKFGKLFDDASLLQVVNGIVLLFLGPLKMGRHTAEEEHSHVIQEVAAGEEGQGQQENKTARALNQAALSISFLVMFVDTIKMGFI